MPWLIGAIVILLAGVAFAYWSSGRPLRADPLPETTPEGGSGTAAQVPGDSEQAAESPRPS
ncbi:MAG: hypothetical protein ACRDQ1_12040 [Sciscionella sp.]